MRSDILNQNSQATGGVKKKVVHVDADITLTNDDSGKCYLLSATGGTVAVTLPTSLENGVYYKFIVEEETPSNAITIAAGAALISFVMKDAGGNASNSTAGTQISNVIIGTSAQKADYVEIMAAGNEWVGSALSSIDDAITTS